MADTSRNGANDRGHTAARIREAIRDEIISGKLKAGEACIFRLKPGVTFKAQANTADCEVEINVLEE